VKNTDRKCTNTRSKLDDGKCRLSILVLAVVLGTPLASFATPTVTLTPSLVSPQPVGTVITWTATASDTDSGTLMYSFNAGPQGGTLALVRDFGPNSVIQSYPALQEGTYEIQVTVRNNTTQLTGTASQTFVATAIASATNPVVVSPTANPLVALFSALPCTAPKTMLVSFKNAAQTTAQLTHEAACNGKSMNFYIAGMLANTQYAMTGVRLSAGTVNGLTKTVNFTTGIIPSTVNIPTNSILSAAPAVAASEPILIHSYLGSGAPTGTDLSGNVVWYYSAFDGSGGILTRAQPGGFFWLYGNGNSNPYLQYLRLFDVAGNTVVETNVGRVNEQLVAAGQQPMTAVDHELRSLGNGDILMMGSRDQVFGPTVQGGADVIYDLLAVLDPGLQLKWSWNATTCGNCATQLPLSRAALLGETCSAPGGGGCPPINPPNTIANDWLHGNSAELAPDGSILVSLRHQDWLLKIDYANGTGTGNILWRMGLDGDFTIVGDSGDSYPWFSHQHDAEWIFTSTFMSLFDNGNTRIAANPGEHSRGQVLNVNQSTMTATVVDNLDMGTTCMALGTAQLLIDQTGKTTGLHFECGTEGAGMSQSQSFYPTGLFNIQSSGAAYRSAQMKDMYSPSVGPN
jgi:arylsulfate sulfotransferase